MASTTEKAAQAGTDIAIVGSAITVIATGGLTLPFAALVAGLAGLVVTLRSVERMRAK